ncbi:SusC/RagA family TonB-linked outer membrane protein, partial [Bacteroides uniformis]
MKNKKYPFLFFLIVLLSTGIGWAQNEKITLHLDNVSLEHVLSKIEEKTAYSFQYSKQVIDVRQKRTIHVDKQTIHNVLETLLKGTSIQYQIKNRQIILSAKKTVKTNTKMLKGIIKDRKTGEPIIGASIAVEKESIGAISDINGNFAINVSADKKIVVSYIGYESQVLDVLDKSFLEIYLSEDIKLIDEVVVVGYGSVSKKNLTTAIAQVKTDKISQAGTSHVNQLLMGRAAGLQATVNSMQPDGKVNISIRGGGNPIYVIDGIVMPNNALSGNCGQVGLPNNIDRNGIANLNPADVESVEILKDASAAIYGIGADNGVILITTKKGKEGAPNIVYDGSYSFVRNYPYLDVLNSKEYMELANVFNKENYLYNNKQYPYGTTPYDGKWKPQFTEADMQNATDTDWKDLVLRNGFLTKHNLTISGGHSKFKYYLGGSYLKQQGTVSRSGMTKYSVHGNLGLDLFPFLNLTSVFNANQNTYDNGIIGTDTGNQGDVAPSVLTSALLYP